MSSLLYHRQPALDEQWFNRLLPYIDELYILLGIPHQQLAKLRQEFESKPFNPDLRPLLLASKQYQQKNVELDALLHDINTQEANQTIRQAYSLKIEELRNQNDLIVALLNKDTNAIVHLNHELYGSTDLTVFAGVCAWLRQIAGEYYDSEVRHIANAAAEVLEQVPNLNGTVHSILPDDHLFKKIRDAHFHAGGYIDQLFGTAVIPDIVTPETGDPITRRVIAAVGSQYTLQDSTDSLWGVMHNEHTVVRPANYRLQRAAFMGIISHEIGSHLLERENGINQPLRLLSVGLDRYETSNEGRAFIREQIMYRSPYELLGEFAWEHIILLYISTSLASGAYREPYDFMSLHKVILPVCRLLKARHLPDNPAVAEIQARDEAWQICTRATKGTAGTGGAFSKGLVYLTGNLSAWKMAAKDPDYVFFGDVGKFDIARTDHRQFLADFGVTPQGYQALT